MKKILTTGLIFILAISNPLNVIGQTRDMAKEYQFEKQLAAIDTSLVKPFKDGTLAMDNLNYALAETQYSEVYEKAPTFEPVVRRLGTIKLQLGELREGLSLCEKAVAINRSSDNIITLASALINSGGSSGNTPPENSLRAIELLNEGKNLPGADDFEYNASFGEAELQLKQSDNFIATTKELMEKHSDKMISHYFAAIVSAQNEEWLNSEKEIRIAQSMGLPEAAVNSFLDSGVGSKATTEFYKKLFLWILVFWAAGFIVLFIVGTILSSYTLKSLDRELRTNSESKSAHTLRHIYRFLINTAGIYYYISLPIILVLVVGLVVGVVYLFLMLGHIPIQLMVVMVVGGCVTIYGMIRSLILKVNYNDPGRELKESDAPGLFALTKEVATTMGTRPIDEIRITPEVDLAVYERGSWREKIKDEGKRILILGTGVLKDFKQDDFKAVIAHEYGHFANRDTAGGAVAMRVKRDMQKYLFALYTSGQTVWWNLAFQFLRLYDFIFGRISNGATRLQEILADRVAAQTYGAVAFQNGLTYVIKRNIEFVKLAKIEIEDARKVNRPFGNLYELKGNSPSNDAIEEELKKSLNKKTNPKDTHPSPVDRFRFIEGLGTEKKSDDTTYVRDFFVDWNSLTEEMTKNIEDSWKKNVR